MRLAGSAQRLSAEEEYDGDENGVGKDGQEERVAEAAETGARKGAEGQV